MCRSRRSDARPSPKLLAGKLTTKTVRQPFSSNFQRIPGFSPTRTAWPWGSRNQTKRFDAERLGIFLATIATDHALIEAVAAEMSEGIETAVSFWMTQIEAALLNPRLTTLGRMHAVQEIVQRYHTGDPSEASHDRYSA